MLVQYIMQNYYGEKEVPGPGSNPLIIKIIKWARKWFSDDDGKTAWCAIFMSYILNELGIFNERLIRARDFLDYFTPVAEPQYGDIVVFWRGSPDSPKGHVAVVIRVVDGIVYCLGGNQNNMVNIKAYAESRVLGYRRIDPQKGDLLVEDTIFTNIHGSKAA